MLYYLFTLVEWFSLLILVVLWYWSMGIDSIDQWSGTMARESDVALFMTASGSLDIFLTRLLRMKLFLWFSIYLTTKPSATPCSTRSRIYSKKHVIRENSDIYHCSKLLILIKNTHVSYIKCWKMPYGSYGNTIKNTVCRFHGSFSQKGSRPLL